MKSDIVQAKIQIRVPEVKWLSQLNEKYPGLSFEILSKFLLEESLGSTLFKVKGRSIGRFLSDLKQIKEKGDLQVLFKGGDLLILNVKTKDPWILKALVETRLLTVYPIKIKEGKIQIETITERSKVDEFLEELEKKGIEFSIKSIGYYEASDSLLTERQREILEIAFDRGYFNIPRDVSLSELAEELEISPSALSETLRRVNKRLARNFLK